MQSNGDKIEVGTQTGDDLFHIDKFVKARIEAILGGKINGYIRSTTDYNNFQIPAKLDKAKLDASFIAPTLKLTSQISSLSETTEVKKLEKAIR